MKNSKKTKEWHAPKSPMGSGDYHGIGIRNPVGRIREDFSASVPKGKLNTPPRSLA